MLTVEATLRDVITRNAPLPPRRLNHADVLTRDLGFDSLAFLMAVGELEQRLDFEFPLMWIDELRGMSFGELVQLIEREQSRNRS